MQKAGVMSKIITLNKNRDFNRIYSRGRSYVSPVLVVYVLKNRENTARLGITTSKKIGNAVQRNRARRLIREAYRTLLPKIRPGFDVVLVARKRTWSVKMAEILLNLSKKLAEARLLTE